MKKAILTVAAAAFAAGMARGELASVELAPGETPVTAAWRGVMVHAISTNAAGTVTLKRISRHAVEWLEERTETNETYAAAWSNVVLRAVTNTTITVWRTNEAWRVVETNGTTNVVVATNFVAQATNAIPVRVRDDMIVTTNVTVDVVSQTNIPYMVVSGTNVAKVAEVRSAMKCVTNALAELTLSGGLATNAVGWVLAPGEAIEASGSAFSGGRVQLIIER